MLPTAEELAEVLEWLYGQCDTPALELVGLDHVRRVCAQAHDLAAILHALGDDEQARLVESLGWEFVCGTSRASNSSH